MPNWPFIRGITLWENSCLLPIPSLYFFSYIKHLYYNTFCRKLSLILMFASFCSTMSPCLYIYFQSLISPSIFNESSLILFVRIAWNILINLQAFPITKLCTIIDTNIIHFIIYRIVYKQNPSSILMYIILQ